MRCQIFRSVMRFGGVALLSFATLFVAIRWRYMPEMIPDHFDFRGISDSMGEKSTILVLLLVGWMVYGMLSFVGLILRWLDGSSGVNGGWGAQRAMGLMISLIRLLTAFVFSYIAICSSLSSDLGGWFLPVFILAGIGTMVGCVILALKKH